jgi:hypothetical protein
MALRADYCTDLCHSGNGCFLQYKTLCTTGDGMNNVSWNDIIVVILVIAVLAIPVAFSYTAIRKRRAVGRVVLRWRPGMIQLLLVLWCIGGMVLAVYLYQSSASRYAKLIFLGAFFSGIMNALGSTIIIGEQGIFIHRRPVPWKNISQFSTWEKSGKHFMSITWSTDDMKQKETMDTFAVPSRLFNVTIALFKNFIPSIQLPRSN